MNNNIIYIVTLILLVCILVKLYNNSKLNVETFSSIGNNPHKNWNTLEGPFNKDTLYIFIYVDDIDDTNNAALHVYLNRMNTVKLKQNNWMGKGIQYLGSAGLNRKLVINNSKAGGSKGYWQKIKVTNFRPERDSIYLIHSQQLNSGRFTGHFVYNSSFYPINSSNITFEGRLNKSLEILLGGMRLGCRQIGNINNWQNHGIKDLNSLWLLAISRGHKFMALDSKGNGYTSNHWVGWEKQDENKCSTGEVEEAESCVGETCKIENQVCKAGNEGTYRSGNWKQLRCCNGKWINRITSCNRVNDETAGFDTYYLWANNKVKDCEDISKLNRKYFMKTSKLVQADYGSQCNVTKGGAKVNVVYRFNIKPEGKLSFCPDPKYTEFNPSGCSNPDNKSSCMNSTYNFYKADTSKCNTIYDISHNGYDNEEFFTILYNAMVKTLKNKTKNYSVGGINYNTEVSFKVSINLLLKYTCNILKLEDEYETKDCLSNISDLSQIGNTITLIQKASKHCEDKPANALLCKQFKEQLESVIKEARVISADYTKGKSCQCTTRISDKKKCLPC